MHVAFDPRQRRIGALAAALGGLSVMAGAFGAHALSGDPRAAGLLATGAGYGLWHALAAILALLLGRTGPAALFVLGVLLFSLSLWALALGAPTIVGVITPFGGTAFILGWLLLAWRIARGQPGGS